jgi:hypothetical protein
MRLIISHDISIEVEINQFKITHIFFHAICFPWKIRGFQSQSKWDCISLDIFKIKLLHSIMNLNTISLPTNARPTIVCAGGVCLMPSTAKIRDGGDVSICSVNCSPRIGRQLKLWNSSPPVFVLGIFSFLFQINSSSLYSLVY